MENQNSKGAVWMLMSKTSCVPCTPALNLEGCGPSSGDRLQKTFAEDTIGRTNASAPCKAVGLNTLLLIPYIIYREKMHFTPGFGNKLSEMTLRQQS